MSYSDMDCIQREVRDVSEIQTAIICTDVVS